MKPAEDAALIPEYLLRMMQGGIHLPPVADLIGFLLSEIRPAMAVIELEADKRHTSPLGTVHGGVLCAIADAAMGLAYATTLKEDETFATVEFKINFLRPVWQGRLRAEGRVVSSGRNLGLLECDVTDRDQRLIARGLSTCMTLRGGLPESDKGRSDHKQPLKRRPK